MSNTLTLISSASSLSAPTRGQAEDSPDLVPPDGASGRDAVLESRGDSLTREMKVALIKMMVRSEQAKEVLRQLAPFGKAECHGSDYRELARLGLAVRKNDAWHVLTPMGRLKAKDALIELARADGIHALDYQFETPAGIAPFVRCTCGWTVRKSKYWGSYRNVLYRFGTQHLEFVGVRT